MTPTSVPLALLALWALAVAVMTWRRRPRRLVGGSRPPGRGHPQPGWHRRRRPRAESELPEVVEAVAAALGAGRSVADGLAAAAAGAEPRLRAELLAVVDRIHRGVPATTALGRWAASSDAQGAGLVAAAVGLSADAGGDRQRALAGVAATLRERRSLEREIRALSSQARTSATVIAVAPAAFAALAAGADSGTARFLVASPGGWACLGIGTGLDLVGWRWMGRITRSVR